jgi:hypothetical protein
MEEVRLAVRYRNGLRLGDLIRWSKARVTHLWMDLGDHLWTDHLSDLLKDHANRWLMARNHFQIRLSIRCLNRFAND